VNAEIPEWLAEIIEKLLAKSPEQRFADAAEVARLLKRHLAHLQHPTTVPMPPRLAEVARGDSEGVRGWQRLYAWVQAPTLRKPVAVGLSLVGAVVALGGVIGTMNYLGSPADVVTLPEASNGGRVETVASGRRAESLPSRDDPQLRALEGPEWEAEIAAIRERLGEVERSWFESSRIAPERTWSESVAELQQRLDDLRHRLDDPTM